MYIHGSYRKTKTGITFWTTLYNFISPVIALRKRKRRRAQCVRRPWILDRPVAAAYKQLFLDLINPDDSSLGNCIRMNMSAFDDLLYHVE